tara:strand:- start:1506 stop:1838 length:333 start_codon:yes stop_codon:yes gene_type:complete
MWTKINDKLLISLGFKRKRVFCKRDNNFTLKYSIEGYDGQIDLLAQFASPNAISPEEQVEYASDIEHLLKYTGDWGYHVYGNDFHITSIYFEYELMMLITALKIEDELND